MSKKCTLKEFSDNHGTKLPAYSNLPVRPRCDRYAAAAQDVPEQRPGISHALLSPMHCSLQGSTCRGQMRVEGEHGVHHVLWLVQGIHLVLIMPCLGCLSYMASLLSSSCRDDDQGLHLRLAQGCSLDSGKAYPQRYGPGKEGPYAEYAGSYGGSDGTPVGDVDYHRPYSHHAHPGSYHSSANSHYASSRPVRGPSPQERPAQYGYEPAGSYPPQYRGPASPPGMPLTGGPPTAGGLGGSVHHGSAYGYGGPGYGHPPQPGYGPPGSYGAPLQHPYGPPAAGPGPCPPGQGAGMLPGAPPGAPLQQGAMPLPGRYGGYGPTALLEPPMPGCYGRTPGYAMAPPPPPPPRVVPPQQAAGQGAASAVAATSSMPGPRAGANGHAATAHAAALPFVSATAAAKPGTGAAAGRSSATAATMPASRPEAAGSRKPTPSAAAEQTEARVEAPAPAAPKNEFAERLAQRALARAKTSLLAGSSSGGSSTDALSRSDSLAHGDAKPPAVVRALDIPAAPGAGATDSNSSSPNEQEGVFVKPTHPFSRPKLMLKPRSALLDGPAHGSGTYSSTSSDSGDAPADHGSGSMAGSTASSVTGGRPRLQLLPRGSSLVGGNSSAPAGTGARKASVFGEAKPREEVLKGRGLDPALVDAGIISPKRSDSATTRPGFSTARSMGSEDDEWHTVAGHGRKGSAAASRDGVLLPGADDFDPFFGSGSARPSYSDAPLPPARAFSRDIMRDGYAAGKRSGLAADMGDEDDSAVFRRALPTRQVPLAI